MGVHPGVPESGGSAARGSRGGRRVPAGRAVLVFLLALGTMACGREEPAAPAVTSASAKAVAESPAPAPSRPRVVVLGDSLTAGLGLPLAEAYPSLLQTRIDEAGLGYEVVNAGVSGDTSAGGLSRLDWALDGDVKVLVVALGGNDALRGLPPEELSRNLSAIITRAQLRNVRVLLAGMEAPPNFGPSYAAAFRRVFADLSRQHHVPLIPFLLDGVAGVESLNQRDGIHPTAEGARRVADTVWQGLQPLLKPA